MFRFLQNISINILSILINFLVNITQNAVSVILIGSLIASTVMFFINNYLSNQQRVRTSLYDDVKAITESNISEGKKNKKLKKIYKDNNFSQMKYIIVYVIRVLLSMILIIAFCSKMSYPESYQNQSFLYIENIFEKHFYILNTIIVFVVSSIPLFVKTIALIVQKKQINKKLFFIRLIPSALISLAISFSTPSVFIYLIGNILFGIVVRLLINNIFSRFSQKPTS